MKTLSLTIAAAALATAAGLSTMAANARTAGVAPEVSQQIADNAPAAHYEWQYHYVGHHVRYEGHWVLVR